MTRIALTCVFLGIHALSSDTRLSGYDILTSGLPLEVDPILNPNTVCKNTPSLNREQLELCKTQADVVASALQGAQMAVHECQQQFAYTRWNCSSLETKNGNPLTSDLLARGFRETAFAHAIISAGMTQAVATSCSAGKLGTCECDKTVKGEGRGWSWGGCSDNALFGAVFTADFMDSRERGTDIKSLMNLHNNRAGRLAVLDNMKTKCKCTGVSGSCTMRTCWKTVPEFKEVGTILMENYEYAVLIRASNRNRGKIRPRKTKTVKQYEFQRNLVYYEPSPSYCNRDDSKDIAGTKGRMCKVDSLGSDNCDTLCCSRGYNRIHATIKRRCRCHFNWCCFVLCDECVEKAWVTICK